MVSHELEGFGLVTYRIRLLAPGEIDALKRVTERVAAHLRNSSVNAS